MGSQAPPVDLRDPLQGSRLGIVPQSRRNAFWQTASDVILRSIPRRMLAGLLQAEHWTGGEDN